LLLCITDYGRRCSSVSLHTRFGLIQYAVLHCTGTITFPVASC